MRHEKATEMVPAEIKHKKTHALNLNAQKHNYYSLWDNASVLFLKIKLASVLQTAQTGKTEINGCIIIHFVRSVLFVQDTS